jgi:hypothetical protein
MENAIAIRPMIYKEAREAVDQINSNMNNVRYLVLDLYEREGWVALGYQSWRECVTAEFQNSQAYLYRQLEAAQTEKVISPIGEKIEIPESQLRPLTKLKDNPEQQREAWQKAVETAPEGKVTAAHVSKVVKEITGEQPKPYILKQSQPTIPEHAVYFATIAISQLERISDDDPTRQKALNMVVDWINKNRKGGNK